MEWLTLRAEPIFLSLMFPDVGTQLLFFIKLQFDMLLHRYVSKSHDLITDRIEVIYYDNTFIREAI